MMERKRSEAYRIGLGVIILLGVLTIGEYLVGVLSFGWVVPLIGIAILKAFFVVRDYMHIGRVFVSDEEVH